MNYRICILSLVIVFSASALPAQHGEIAITATDMLQVRQSGSVGLSPDGKHIIYTLRNITDDEDNEGEYRYDTQLFLP